MRFGSWRGVALAFAVSSALLAGLAGTTRADLFHDIPREVGAVNVNTGGPYFAPPIPYGCYAKDHGGCLRAGAGMACGLLGKLKVCLHCGGLGCNQCGDPCGGCGGRGCGACGGSGFLHHGGDPGAACGGAGCGSGHGLGLFQGHGHGHGQGGRGCGLCGGAGCGACTGHASTVASSGQALPFPSAQCGTPGCTTLGKHSHGNRTDRACYNCGGRGCRFCGVKDQFGGGSCGGCGGRGCGLCGGGGLFHHGGGGGDPCGSCGGRGCGLCGGRGMGGPCNACGGRGCGLCGKAHSLLGLPMGLVNKALHRGDIKYFVGPGGPVPITPGYVPYVNVTRSPRDFLAFPPFVDTVP